MQIVSNILRDVNEEGRIYYIDLSTGVKAEVFYISSKNSIILIRGEIEREDIQRANPQINLAPLKSIKNTNEEIIQIMKNITNQIKTDEMILKCYPNLQSIEFHVANYNETVINIHK